MGDGWLVHCGVIWILMCACFMESTLPVPTWNICHYAFWPLIALERSHKMSKNQTTSWDIPFVLTSCGTVDLVAGYMPHGLLLECMGDNTLSRGINHIGNRLGNFLHTNVSCMTGTQELLFIAFKYFISSISSQFYLYLVY